MATTIQISRYPLPPAHLGADGLQRCRYRQERPVDAAEPSAVEVRCIAKAGASLGRKDRDLEAIARTCNTCPIPCEAERRPCLYLVPMKTERDGRTRDYFTCRWFYKDRPEAPDESTDWMCGTCPYWFPAPPHGAVRGLEGVVQRMVAYHQAVWKNPPRPPVTPRSSTPPPTNWLRRLVDWIRWWVLPF
jgi:hypothetical protein